MVDHQLKLEEFNSKEVFTVLEMDTRYNLILGIPWLEKHEPWIEWRSKTIRSCSSGVGKTLVSNKLIFTMRQKKRSSALQSYAAENDPHFIGLCHTIDIPQAREDTKLYGVSTGECCRHLRNEKSKESTVAGYATTPTNTVVESVCGSATTKR
ncbi:putative aspartic peptidase domain superfamily [Plasmopara halstedii]